MDQTFLLALVVALVVVLAAIGRIATRSPAPSAHAAGDAGGFATSTEGMKVCPKCRMGNLWTERTCINCGTKLRG
jgi:hypothetical protein